MSALKYNRIICFRWMCCAIWLCWVGLTGADEIILKNNDVIHGQITQQTIDYLVVEHPDLGTLQIPLYRVESFTLEAEQKAPSQESKETPKKQPAPEEPTEEPEDLTDGIPDTLWFMPEFSRWNNWAAKRKEKGWKVAVSLSLDGSWGNTDERSFRFSSNFKRTLEKDRLGIDLTIYNKTKVGETTDNKLTSGLLYDWLKPGSRWFYFIEGRYDFDEFESWRHRASSHAGPGYNLVNDPRFRMDLRVGPGAKKEWGSENDDLYAEGIGALDFEWKMSKRQTMTAYVGYYPVLTDFSDYRTRSGLNWKYLMDLELNLSLLFGFEHEYMNIVDPGDKRNDTRIFTGIRYDF